MDNDAQKQRSNRLFRPVIDKAIYNAPTIRNWMVRNLSLRTKLRQKRISCYDQNIFDVSAIFYLPIIDQLRPARQHLPRRRQAINQSHNTTRKKGYVHRVRSHHRHGSHWLYAPHGNAPHHTRRHASYAFRCDSVSTRFLCGYLWVSH